MKKFAMISQPMAGLTVDEIREVRDEAKELLEGEGYIVLDTLFGEEWYKVATKGRGSRNRPLLCLAGSLRAMSRCDMVYFVEGWRDARGCRFEHDAAEAYGLQIREED